MASPMQKPIIGILIYALILITYDFNIGIYVLTNVQPYVCARDYRLVVTVTHGLSIVEIFNLFHSLFSFVFFAYSFEALENTLIHYLYAPTTPQTSVRQRYNLPKILAYHHGHHQEKEGTGGPCRQHPKAWQHQWRRRRCQRRQYRRGC